jgi:methyltransferase (TIGR00027 family)
MKHDQASHTARFVSNGIYWVSQHRRLGVEVPESLARCTAEMTRCLEIADSVFGDRFARRLLLLKAGVMQACSVPGIYLHQVLRKRHIESVARAVLEGGVEQVVIIGAGFDTLALRLDCRVIEIDHPATQREKRAALEQFTLPTGHCDFLSADLASETLGDALARCPDYDPNLATLFVAEGLSMYLTESSMRGLLECIAGKAPGSQFLFTYMEETLPGCYDFMDTRRATAWWLALRSERFTWGLKRDQVPAFLSSAGFDLRDHWTTQELGAELLTPANRSARLAGGEHTVLAAP